MILALLWLFACTEAAYAPRPCTDSVHTLGALSPATIRCAPGAVMEIDEHSIRCRCPLIPAPESQQGRTGDHKPR